MDRRNVFLFVAFIERRRIVRMIGESYGFLVVTRRKNPHESSNFPYRFGPDPGYGCRG